MPPGVIGFEAAGKLKAEDYRDVVLPALEEAAASGEGDCCIPGAARSESRMVAQDIRVRRDPGPPRAVRPELTDRRGRDRLARAAPSLLQRRPDATVRRTSAMVRAWVVPDMSQCRRIGSVIVTDLASTRRFAQVEVTDNKMRRRE